jgi:hypothetical protein
MIPQFSLDVYFYCHTQDELTESTINVITFLKDYAVTTLFRSLVSSLGASRSSVYAADCTEERYTICNRIPKELKVCSFILTQTQINTNTD